jgi:amidohydrolase
MNRLRAGSLPADRLAELIGLYEHLHRNPELAFQEFETAAALATRLTGLGLSVHAGVGGTGIVGLLHNGSGPTIVLRADMDALPVREETGLAYASTARATGSDGVETAVMHACGHDIHMVSMLGAVEVLAANRAEWAGTLVVLFQPAEEIGKGARAMIDDGVFALFPTPSVILGQHVGNRPAGTVAFTAGPAMAAADSLRVVINGRGAHGSRPEASIDPIVIASSIVMRLQTIVAREISPSDVAVVTVGSFHAGSKENIIPEAAELKINLRSLTPSVRRRLLSAVSRIVIAECAAAGVEVAPLIESIGSFPRLVNEAAGLERTVAALRAGLGVAFVDEVPAITISEDFGEFGTAADVPSFFWFIGSTEPERYAAALADDSVDRLIPANHSARFAPEPHSTITTGIDALLLAFGAWTQRKSP